MDGSAVGGQGSQVLLRSFPLTLTEAQASFGLCTTDRQEFVEARMGWVGTHS